MQKCSLFALNMRLIVKIIIIIIIQLISWMSSVVNAIRGRRKKKHFCSLCLVIKTLSCKESTLEIRGDAIILQSKM